MEIIRSMLESWVAIGFISSATIGLIYSIWLYSWSSFWLYKTNKGKMKTKSLESMSKKIGFFDFYPYDINYKNKD